MKLSKAQSSRARVCFSTEFMDEYADHLSVFCKGPFVVNRFTWVFGGCLIDIILCSNSRADRIFLNKSRSYLETVNMFKSLDATTECRGVGKDASIDTCEHEYVDMIFTSVCKHCGAYR